MTIRVTALAVIIRFCALDILNSAPRRLMRRAGFICTAPAHLSSKELNFPPPMGPATHSQKPISKSLAKKVDGSLLSDPSWKAFCFAQLLYYIPFFASGSFASGCDKT